MGEWRSRCLRKEKSDRSLPVTPLISLERKQMKNHLMRLWKEEEGQDLTEYALLLVLISLVAIVAMSAVGTAVNKVFSNAAANLAT